MSAFNFNIIDNLSNNNFNLNSTLINAQNPRHITD
jgi:hypothetical protein